MRRVVFVVSLFFVAGCTPTQVRIDAPALKAAADEAFLAGNFARAAANYEDYAKTAPPDLAWTLLQLGKCHNGLEQWDRAAKDFTDALAAHPTDDQKLQGLYYRAIAYGGTGRYRESLADFQAISQVEHRQAVKEDEFTYRHALAKIRAGDWLHGQAGLTAFITAHPQSPLVQDAKDRLALKSTCILIARAKDATAARTAIAEARSKGYSAEAIPGPRDVLIVTGSFKSATEARAELPRVQASYRDAFIVP
jgi:tetratricopeptide (TPR) repeat protein